MAGKPRLRPWNRFGCRRPCSDRRSTGLLQSPRPPNPVSPRFICLPPSRLPSSRSTAKYPQVRRNALSPLRRLVRPCGYHPGVAERTCRWTSITMTFSGFGSSRRLSRGPTPRVIHGRRSGNGLFRWSRVETGCQLVRVTQSALAAGALASGVGQVTADLVMRLQGELKRRTGPGIARGPQIAAMVLHDRAADR